MIVSEKPARARPNSAPATEFFHVPT